MLDQLMISQKGPVDVSKFKTPHNSMWFKPRGGLWSSTIVEPILSDWYSWCLMNGYGITSHMTYNKLIPDKNVRVYLIDRRKDYEELVNRYPRIEPIEYWFGWHLFNVDSMIKDYDVLQVTKQGIAENDMALSTWDVESSLWLNPKFTVRVLGKEEPYLNRISYSDIFGKSIPKYI